MATNWDSILSNTNNLNDVLAILQKVLASLDVKADITTIDEALTQINMLDADVQEKLSDITAAITKFDNTGGFISAPTLTALQAITPEYDYQLARVDATGDEYRWNPTLTTASKWEATGRNFLSESNAYTNTKVDPLINALSSTEQAATTLTEDAFMHINGTQTASTNYDMYSFDLLDTRDVFITTYCTGSVTNVAPVIFKNAAGAVVGTFGELGVTYTDQRITVPSSAKKIFINLRTSGVMQDAKLKIYKIKDSIASDVDNLKSSNSLLTNEVNSVKSDSQSMKSSLSTFKQVQLSFIIDKFVNSNGGVLDGVGQQYAEYTLTSSQIKISTRTTNANVPALVFKNASGAVVGTLAGNQSYVDYVVTPPNGATKVFLNHRNDGTNTPKLSDFQVSSILAQDVEDLKSLSVISNWKNKTWASLGDSITQGATWQSYVAAKLGLSYTNFGIGGTKISGSDDNAMCSDARINAIAETFDLITLMGGANDWAQNVPLGAIDSTDVTTFNGALNAWANKAFTRWPTKKIAVATTPYGEIPAFSSRGWPNAYTNTLGLTTNDYAQAIRDFCKRKNLYCIDVALSAGWGTYNITEALGGSTTDHLHPVASSNAAKGIGRVYISALQYIEPI